MPTFLDDVLMALPKGGDGSGSHRTPTRKTGGGRASMRGPLETAETPVNLGMPIIARGVFPFPGLYSSGCLKPMAILLSQTSKGWNFRKEPPCPACRDPKRVPAGFIPHVDHAGPWISLGLTYMNGVSPRKNGGQAMWGLT